MRKTSCPFCFLGFIQRLHGKKRPNAVGDQQKFCALPPGCFKLGQEFLPGLPGGLRPVIEPGHAPTRKQGPVTLCLPGVSALAVQINRLPLLPFAWFIHLAILFYKISFCISVIAPTCIQIAKSGGVSPQSEKRRRFIIVFRGRSHLHAGLAQLHKLLCNAGAATAAADGERLSLHHQPVRRHLQAVLPRQYMHNKENAVTMRLSAHYRQLNNPYNYT